MTYDSDIAGALLGLLVEVGSLSDDALAENFAGEVEASVIERTANAVAAAGWAALAGSAIAATEAGRAVHEMPLRTRDRLLREALTAAPPPCVRIDRIVWEAARVEQRRRRITARLIILDGLLKGLGQWDVVGNVVADAASRAEAVAGLGKPPLELSEVQAEHVLDARFAMRTRESLASLRAEREVIAQELRDLG